MIMNLKKSSHNIYSCENLNNRKFVYVFDTFFKKFLRSIYNHHITIEDILNIH